MIKKKNLLILLAIVVMIAIGSLPALATTYYVKNGGDDSADGLSDATAWATIVKVNTETFAAGDTICFKRGSTWRFSAETSGGKRLKPQSGDATGDVTYTSYGNGAMPLFLGSEEKNSTSDWTDLGGNVWTTANGSLPVEIGNVIYNNEESCGLRRWDAANLSAQGEWNYDVTNDKLLIYSTENPATYYTDIECAIDRDIIFVDGKSYITISELDLRYGARHAIHVYGQAATCQYITIRDNDISYIGGAEQDDGAQVRCGNGVQLWNNIQDITVERNRIWEIYDAGLANESGTIARLSQSNIYFRYNTVWNCAYSYTYLAINDRTDVDYIYVENNTFVDAGNGWSYPADPRGYSLRFWNGTGKVKNFYIRNNVIYEAKDRCWILPTVIDVTSNYNNWYQATGGMIEYGSKVYWMYEFENYQADTGQDANSIAEDPDFVDLANNNYRLQSSSHSINRALDIGETEDFDYNPIVPAGEPDIGAFEYQITAKALSPTPKDGATNQDIDVDLSWVAGLDAVSHDVYFGIDTTPDDTEFQGNQTTTTYDPGTLDGDTTYYWRIDEIDSGDVVTTGDVWSFTTEAAGGGIVGDVANSDYSNTAGDVTGTYVDTHTQNNTYESILEHIQGNRPGNRYDWVDHVWDFTITGNNHIFYIDAFYTDGGDADTGFIFQWSTSPDSGFTDMLTVTKTADDNTYQSYDLGTPSGTIYIKVIDTNRTDDNRKPDEIYIDHMYISE